LKKRRVGYDVQPTILQGYSNVITGTRPREEEGDGRGGYRDDEGSGHTGKE